MDNVKPQLGAGEAIHVLMKALSGLFGLGFLGGAFTGHPDFAATCLIVAIVIWFLRAFFVTPIVRIFVGKRRLDTAWQDYKDRR